MRNDINRIWNQTRIVLAFDDNNDEEGEIVERIAVESFAVATAAAPSPSILLPCFPDLGRI